MRSLARVVYSPVAVGWGYIRSQMSGEKLRGARSAYVLALGLLNPNLRRVYVECLALIPVAVVQRNVKQK